MVYNIHMAADSLLINSPNSPTATSSINIQPQIGHNAVGHVSAADTFMIYHQNIRGLRNKRIEILNSLLQELPQILCITEHHLKEFKLERTLLEHYNLGAMFCRKNLKDGGASIFVHESLSFANINLHEFSKEQDIEACTIKIHLPAETISVISIYRSPNGNFTLFTRTTETIRNKLYSANLYFIICGDVNIS
jgi:exonuclease III